MDAISPRRRRPRPRRSSRWAQRLSYLRYDRRVRWSVLAVGGLLVLGVVWIVVTALMARSQLKTVQQRLVAVRILVAQGRIDDAKKEAATIGPMSDRADRLTSGPAWWVGAHVPVAGRPLQVARASTAVTDRIGGRAVPDLLDVAADVDPNAVRVSGDTIRLAPLTRAAPKLDDAAAVLRGARQDIAGLPDTWLTSVNHQRDTLATQLGGVADYVSAAARAARVLPSMLGADGHTMRYFIGLQNEAELRGTGGLPGAFTIARVRDGTITFERFESDAALLPATRDQLIRTQLDFGASYDRLYGAGRPTQQFNDSNVSPNFAYAAQIWAAMWEKLHGQRIDGAVAVDPTALSYFLAVTGAAPVKGTSTAVSSDNVVALTQRDAYALYPDTGQRRAFLVDVLRAASEKLTSGAGVPYQLAQAASRSSREQRLLVWTRNPATERLIEQTSYAGDIAARPARPFSGLIVNNAAAGKLDYYLARSLSYTRTGCDARRDVTVTFTLDNTAPASGLPPYVTDRLDADVPATAVPGDNRSLVDYYATGGAVLRSVLVNGRPATAAVLATQGRAVFRLDLELPHGTTTTVTLQLSEPAGTGKPLIWRQPGVTPLAVQEFNQSC